MVFVLKNVMLDQADYTYASTQQCDAWIIKVRDGDSRFSEISGNQHGVIIHEHNKISYKPL
jgi:hypothetical protein